MISRDTVANVTGAGPAAQQSGWRELIAPRGVALLCMAAYATACAAILYAANEHAYGWFYAALAAASAGAIGARRQPGRAFGDFAPLVLMPLLYAGIPRLITALDTSYHDSLVQQWEMHVFGTQPARVFAASVPNLLASEFLHAGYLAYYVAIFAPALWLYWRGERRGFAETVMALTITYAICWSLFAIFPVEGPRYEWGAPAGVPDGPVRRLVVAILASGSSRGAAFPSSHMAVSVVQAMMAWRWQARWVAVLLTVIAGLVGLGAVYGGFHYGIDMIGGGLLGLGLGGVVLWWTRTAGARA